MRRIASIAAVSAFALTAGCYHAVVDTGRPVSGQTVEKKWAASYIGGLVPPAVINTASQCPNGASKVETQHSFANQLVGMITFGIYTPMTVTVSCASGGAASTAGSMDAGATLEEQTAAFGQAAERAALTGAPVLVRF